MVEDVTDLNELRVTVVDDYLIFWWWLPSCEERADGCEPRSGVFTVSTALIFLSCWRPKDSGVSRLLEGMTL